MKLSLMALVVKGCLLVALQMVLKVLHWRGSWWHLLRVHCTVYSLLICLFLFVKHSCNWAFLSLATEGIPTDIKRKHFQKFKTIHNRKGGSEPWEVVSSLSPGVFRQSLADDFGREASCTGRELELADLPV